MSAFYFGPPGAQLFGYFHEAAGPDRGAVLLCGPWAREYEYAHRAMTRLAELLADDGHFVLRFDYAGTGDSWGDTTEADLDRWVGDAGTALDELRALSGRPRVDLVGLRLGGLVASRAAVGRRDVDRMVLWDPLVDGRRWVEERSWRPVDGGDVELDRTVVRRSFLDELLAVDAGSYPDRIPAQLHVLVTQTPPDEPDPGRAPVVGGVVPTRMAQPPAWEEDPVVWAGPIPAAALEYMIQRLRRP